MCLIIGLTLLGSTTEIKPVFSSQYTAGETVWSDRDSMYRRIALFFLTDLYMDLISP